MIGGTGGTGEATMPADVELSHSSGKPSCNLVRHRRDNAVATSRSSFPPIGAAAGRASRDLPQSYSVILAPFDFPSAKPKM